MTMFKSLLLVMTTVLLVACGAPNTSGARVEKVEHGGEFEIDYDNPAMANDLRINLLQLHRRNDFLNAQVSVESLSSKDKIYQYKFVWMDADGMLVAPNTSSWRPLTVHGKELVQLQGVATQTRADRVRFQIRRAFK